MIPYPLSYGSKCGDPLYFNFNCKIDTGQVLFNINGSAYPVTIINPETSTFLIQVQEKENCSSPRLREHIPELSPPFRRIHFCSSTGTDNGGSMNTVEVGISWDPPEEPSCNSPADCKGWPNSTCRKGKTMKRCLCNRNFIWDRSSLNCTQSENSVHQVNL